MRSHTLKWLFILILGYAYSLLAQSVSNEQANRCSALLAAHQKGAQPLELLDRPPEPVLRRIKTERACEISYSFRGGAEKLLIAEPAVIQRDADRFQFLFQYFATLPNSDKEMLKAIPEGGEDGMSNAMRLAGVLGFSEDHKGISEWDTMRLADIAKGLDREQVRLYGRFLLMQSFRLHGQPAEAAKMFDLMRRRLQIKSHKLDFLEQSTYFTKQTLQNLIAIQGFAAKSEVPNSTLQQDGDLVADFLDNIDALLQLMAVMWPVVRSVDPDLILSKLRDPSQLGLNTPDWDSSHRLSHLAGSFQDGPDTILFIKGKQLHALKVSSDGSVDLLDAAEAGPKLQSFYRGEIRKFSTDDMALFNVLGFPDGSHQVDINGKEIVVSPTEFKELQGGQALGENHALTIAMKTGTSAKVLYASPIMQFSDVTLRQADEFVFALQKSYPTLPIYRDPLSAETNERVKQLRVFTVAGPSNITAIVADDSFRPRVDDFNLINRVKADLASAGVQVLSFKDGESFNWKGGQKKGLIVITGHSNEALSEFVRKLGESGVFEGNFVLFNSCETELTRKLVNEIDIRYKAAATFTYQGKIPVPSLEGFLHDFAGRITKDNNQNFGEVLAESLHSRHLNGIWTVSRMEFDAAPFAQRGPFVPAGGE